MYYEMQSDDSSDFVYDTAGQEAHRSLKGGYCAVRALANATGMPWPEAEAHIRKHAKAGRTGGKISRGVYKEDMEAALAELGWVRKPAPKFDGRKARPRDLTGICIASQAKHFAAVKHGTVHDIWDCSDKMVYFYWTKGE